MSGSERFRKRLEALRQALMAAGCDGFWLPRTDPHGNEYLPPHEERVAWLTGFTGSAATVVVLPHQAAIFVDGRYTLQVREEVDPSLFAPHNVGSIAPEDWVANELPPGGRLGYDPFRVSAATVLRLERAVRRRKGALVALLPNPVDQLWDERPPAPRTAIERLPLAYAGESSAEKRRRIGEAIAGSGADWLLVTACDSIAWLLNLRGSDVPFNPLILSYLLVHRSGRCRWFVDGPRAGLEALDEPDLEVFAYGDLLSALDSLGREGASILVDPERVHAGFIERLRKAGAEVIEGEDPIPLAKAQKNAVEIAGARRAHLRDGLAMVRFLHWLSTVPLDGSVSESQVAARVDAERARDPLFRGPSFATIVGWGPNGAIVHYRIDPRQERRLTAGSLLLVDSGGQYLDATTDVTRTIALGEPTAEMCRRFTDVLEGHVALATAIFPAGTSGGQLDTLARLPLWRRGLDYDHGTGHGVGAYLCVHEGPQRIAKRAATAPLEPGMILSNEPGYYREGAFGIRIENLVLVTEVGALAGSERRMLTFETLTMVPIDRRLILRDELSAAARAWVDRYHAQVWETLAPHLEPEPRAWLEAACRPL